MTKRVGLIVVVLGALSVAACGVTKPASESESEQPAPGWESISRDLALGSRGSDVAVLHEYLTNFGYFPNTDLQRRYPA